MANTYLQIFIQAVFTVQGRQNFITSDWRDELHKYIAGIIEDENAKSLAVGGWKDHVHVFFSMHRPISISDIMQTIKCNSSLWINKRDFTPGKFSWQEGYGAFSYSRSQIDRVIKYIMNQETHHKKVSFKEEYLKLLQKFDVQYDERYLFEFYD